MFNTLTPEQILFILKISFLIANLLVIGLIIVIIVQILSMHRILKELAALATLAIVGLALLSFAIWLFLTAIVIL